MRPTHAALFALLFSTNALAQSRPAGDEVRRPVRIALADFGAAASDAPVRVAQNLAAWRAHLAARRETQLQRLAAYTEAGVFPRNTQGIAYLNIFRDESGNLCAMANLIAASGQTALVESTARSNNGVRLGELTSGPLVEWMATSGLTREEIAAIQEPDMPMFGMNDPIVNNAERTRAQAHFRAVLAMLRANTARSLDIAVSRLGALVGAPPARV